MEKFKKGDRVRLTNEGIASIKAMDNPVYNAILTAKEIILDGLDDDKTITKNGKHVYAYKVKTELSDVFLYEYEIEYCKKRTLIKKVV